MTKQLWVLAFFVSMVPRLASAQSCNSIGSEAPTEMIASLGDFFYESDNADSRAGMIEQLDPAAQPGPQVVADSVCDVLVEAVLSRLRRYNPRWATQDQPYTSAVVRFGPYYVVEVREPLPPVLPGTIRPTGRGPIYVYRVSDLSYIMGLM
jgi:hypothetical protein